MDLLILKVSWIILVIESNNIKPDGTDFISE